MLLSSQDRTSSRHGPDDARRRKTGVRFLRDAALRLRLPRATLATAVHYFHTYLGNARFAENDLYLAASACLFLASKVDERPRKIRDIVNVTYRVRNPDKEPLRIGQEYWDLKEQVILKEQSLLRWLSFDTAVDLPYKYLLNFLKSLRAPRELAQLAWTLISDSDTVPISLQYQPHVIACAGIFLASKILHHPLPERNDRPGSKAWYEVFNAPFEIMEKCCEHILDAYADESPGGGGGWGPSVLDGYTE
mmetsp:Transcript_22167/g.36726  ORF Transcript_22167/g.36726 Transcript_22167/m.36726 type:complete len:249 (+) Transcript_22167:90-836(+)